MPVLKFQLDYLLNRIGVHDAELLRDILFRLKCETDILEDGQIEVEVNPDRPDMYSVEGIRRAVLGLLGREKGWRTPRLSGTGLNLSAEKVETRPYILAAVVYNVNIEDEEDLKYIIQFQEKLHDTIGRRRRKIAIGFHDLEKLPGKRIEYKYLPVASTEFIPLGGDTPSSAAEILEETEQGVKYGRISLGEEGKHPFLLADGEVIAMPPVINSNITRVEVGTRHLFIDVTGTDLSTVSKVLDIIVSNLAERPDASVGTLYVDTPYYRGLSPRLETRKMTLSAEYASKALGYYTTPQTLAHLLETMRYKIDSILPHGVRVIVPPYRADIIGEIDLVEDVAIAIGYDALYPRYRVIPTRGSYLTSTEIARSVRILMVGLGFTEVLQLVLTSPTLLTLMGLDYVRVENPVQQEYSVLRPSLVPGLLSVLRENQHVSKPVKVFEIGDTITPVDGTISENMKLAAAVMDVEVSMELIQAPIYTLLRILDIPFEVETVCPAPYAIKGRCGSLKTPDGSDLGFFGEIHPSVLERLGIEYPVAFAELNLEAISSWKSRTRNLE
ncbi:MAG: phenylalanine--tRNA ligase subunit beta [Desulfurococcales archaeon]|nr:phenylalanine--tRNA ligase subunit beta [Desulfurococcales archaeon]